MNQKSVQNELKELLQLVPEWDQFLPVEITITATKTNIVGSSEPLFRFFERIGPKAIYRVATSVNGKQIVLLKLVRDHYLIKVASDLLAKNPTLRRYFQERRVDKQSQTGHIASLAAELAFKLDAALRKKIGDGDETGFKVLLPAYIQSTVNNAVIDFVKVESNWEKRTLQDMGLDPDQDDPRETSADDFAYIPENVALSKEKVKYLNELRTKLEVLFKNTASPDPSLLTVDCVLGLGLSQHSKPGVEMTMRECCDELDITGETQARKIARCQVLLDKGLDQIRQLMREQLPGIAEYRQREININTASRRDLRHQLDLTDGEIDRLVSARQFSSLSELVEKSIIKSGKLSELSSKGATAVFVPIDLNSATARDLVDILGLSKESAQRLAELRPFDNLEQIKERKVLDKADLSQITGRGAVLRKCVSSQGVSS